MATIREDGTIQLECDNPDCKTVSEVYSDSDFKIMMKDAKAAGWNTFKRNGKWVNFCQWICAAPKQ